MAGPTALHDETVPGGDGRCGREIDEFIRVLENLQLQHIGDDFEWFEPEKLGQLSQLDVIRHEDCFARLARLQQISSS